MAAGVPAGRGGGLTGHDGLVVVGVSLGGVWPSRVGAPRGPSLLRGRLLLGVVVVLLRQAELRGEAAAEHRVEVREVLKEQGAVHRGHPLEEAAVLLYRVRARGPGAAEGRGQGGRLLLLLEAQAGQQRGLHLHLVLAVLRAAALLRGFRAQGAARCFGARLCRLLCCLWVPLLRLLSFVFVHQ